MLDPSAELRKLESAGNNAGRLALMDEMKTMPFGAVWDRLCQRDRKPLDRAWMADVQRYEERVLSRRR